MDPRKKGTTAGFCRSWLVKWEGGGGGAAGRLEVGLEINWESPGALYTRPILCAEAVTYGRVPLVRLSIAQTPHSPRSPAGRASGSWELGGLADVAGGGGAAGLELVRAGPGEPL